MTTKQNVEEWFLAYNALDVAIAISDKAGNIVFLNTALESVLPENKKEHFTIFDLFQDHRIEESLKRHIISTNKEVYAFSATINHETYHFHVTRKDKYFICCGQSENDIENYYHLQISSQRKMLEMKSKLLEVSMLDKNNFDTALLFILKSASEILGCERVSYWQVNKELNQLTCEMLFLKSKDTLIENSIKPVLNKGDIPVYFEYINKENAFIMASDIFSHPATKEFTDFYSKPQNIFSLLDVPVWHNNRLYAIICCEQVGKKKEWQLEDAQFMLSLCDNISLCLQTKEKVNAENKLLSSNEKLRKSNADLEHFATIAAHDMKSPLRNVVNFLSLLKQKHSNSLNAEAQDYLNFTLQNAKHLNELISDLLAYSRLEQKLGVPAIVNVEELIGQIKIEQQDFIAEKKGTIVIKTALPVLKIQRNLLYQLFSNIIHNAIKFSHTNLPPVLEIEVAQTKQAINFIFSDNGIGIDDAYAEKIFSLFGRQHSIEEFDGTGIGLATCKRIAELFNGNIHYEKRNNPKGSVFIISMPIGVIVEKATTV